MINLFGWVLHRANTVKVIWRLSIFIDEAHPCIISGTNGRPSKTVVVPYAIWIASSHKIPKSRVEFQPTVILCQQL